MKEVGVRGISRRSRLRAGAFGLAPGRLCRLVFAVASWSIPLPPPSRSRRYLNDAKVHVEKKTKNRAAAGAKTDSCLAMNHTWVQINAALLANRHGTEILIGWSRFWSSCDWSASKDKTETRTRLLALQRGSLVKNSNTCIAYTGC